MVPKLKKYDKLTHSIEYEKRCCEKCQMFKSVTDFTDKPVNFYVPVVKNTFAEDDYETQMISKNFRYLHR